MMLLLICTFFVVVLTNDIPWPPLPISLDASFDVSDPVVVENDPVADQDHYAVRGEGVDDQPLDGCGISPDDEAVRAPAGAMELNVAGGGRRAVDRQRLPRCSGVRR